MTTHLDENDPAESGALSDLLDDIYPLTGLQQGLLFHHLLGGVDYLLQAWVEVAGRIDEMDLQASIDMLLRRHPQLGAGFWADEIDEPVQFVPRNVDVPVTIHRCAAGEPSDDPATDEVMAAMGRDMDLSRPPLLRFALIQGRTRARLVLTAHHILLDGWSVPLVFTELLSALSHDPSGARAVSDVVLARDSAPEPVLFRDFLAWLGEQDEQVGVAAYLRMLHGWQGPTLVADLAAAKGSPSSVFPAGSPAQEVLDRGFHGQGEYPAPLIQLTRALDRTQTAAVVDGLRTAGLTLATAVRALWAITLGGLTGSSDVVFGSTVSGRDADLPGVDRIIGLLINTVPVRGQLRPSDSLLTLMRSLQDQQAQLWEHQHVGLRAIQSASGQAPLFDTLVVIENHPSLPESPLGPRVLATGASDETHYPLTLQVEPGAELSLILTARPGLVDPSAVRAAAERLLDLFDVLSRAGGLDRTLASLGAPAEPAMGPDRVLPTVTLTDLLAAAIEAHPDQPAVRFGSTHLTYAELGRRAERIAKHLRTHGVGVDDVVALSMERCENLLPAVLGILWAGGVYLPLDPTSPVDRTARMSAIARPLLVLTTELVDGLVDGLVVDHDADEKPGGATQFIATPVLPDSLAYVIFTSGSTGTPKGVGVSHRAIVNRLLWMQETYGLISGEPVLHKTPLSFDVSVWELFWPLIAGATVVVAPPATHRDPEALLELMVRERITTVHFVPSMLRAFTLAVADLSDTHLDRVLCSGEALLASDVDDLRRITGSCSAAAVLTVHNLYGPTEAAVDVTYAEVPRSEVPRVELLATDVTRSGSAAGDTISIGSPVWNTGVHVLDDMLRPVPLGFPGELYLVGVQLARGYLGRTGLTAERFVAAPNGNGDRMYRTGDLVRARIDGGLDYLGRSDDQVKIRGMRIEPAEIGAVLGEVLGVVRAVVIPLTTGPSVRLVGFLVAESASAVIDLELIRAHAARTLPEHMVPGLLLQLPEMPLTPNGKLDRGALAELAQTALRHQNSAPTAPLDGAAEICLARVIADCLELAGSEPGSGDAGVALGSAADFFDLGGDSIIAIRLVGRYRIAGWAVSLRDVFENRTVRGIAAVASPVTSNELPEETLDLLDSLTAEQRALLQRLSPGHGPVLPLAPLQEGLYFHAAMVRGDLDVYQVQNCVQFDQRVDLATMQAAGTMLLRRYPNLRASFHDEGLDQPIQVFAADLPMPIVEIDLSDLDSAAAERAVDEFVTSDVGVGFDLATPPLIRLTLLHLPPSQHDDADGPGSTGAERSSSAGRGPTLLVVTHHHILTDGWSQTLFMADLLEFFGALRARGTDGDPETLDAETLDAETLDPAPDWVEYLRYVSNTDQQQARAAWARALADVDGSTVLVPVAGSERAVLSEVVEYAISESTTDGLRALARRCGVTLSTLLATAWGLTLRAISGRDDIVFGTTVSGRPADIPDVERMVGMLMNTVPVRVRIDPRESLAELLHRIMLEQADLMPHHHLGLAHIQRAAGVGALFDTLYVFRNLPIDTVAQQERFDRNAIGRTTAMDGTHYAMTMAVNPGAALSVDLAYRPDLVDPDRAAGTLRRFSGLLEQMAAQGADTRVVAGLQTQLAAEESQLRIWNSTKASVPDETVIDVLRRSVDADPDGIALVFGEQELTFRQLMDRTDRLAALLRSRGVRAESVVAICLPRTANAVISILAVLAAGGAYLPLDRDHPGDRLSAMVADAAAGWMITDAGGDDRVRVPSVTQVIRLDDEQTDSSCSSVDLVQWRSRMERIDPDSAAYVIYTSGSTGRPKGVIVGHRGLTNMLVNHRSAIFDPAIELAARNGVTRRLRVAHTVSFAFDMSWEELFWMADGHTVHVIDEAARLDVDTLVRHYRQVGVDVVNVTPSYAAELIDAGLLDAGGPTLVLLGGEAVPVPLWQRLRQSPKVMAYNLYGPTEYTINALGSDVADSLQPTVGTPIRNTAARVLDSGLRPVAIGAVGELYLSGIGTARGYLGRPGLTAERFVADPHLPGGRLYRTGDLVRYLPTGALEYLGRTDDQVKIRGFRVELGEIESVLAGLPGVKAAAAVVVSADLLVGYLVQDTGRKSLDLAEIRRIIAQSLPSAMVPAEFVLIPSLPLTVNGKIDRAALPAPERSRSVSRPPADARERIVCLAAAQVLGIASPDGSEASATAVGPDDNFFELGGHSLLAMRLAARIKAESGLAVPVSLVMTTNSLGDLAAQAGLLGRDSAVSEVLTLRTGTRPPLFCVHPASGFAWQYAGLLPYLEPDRPVIGIQSPLLSGAPVPDSIEELAARYLQRIQQEQPTGPYHLLGYSFGGTVAHHIAALLAVQGERVAYLAVIDAGPREGLGDPANPASRDTGVEQEMRFLLQVAGADLGDDVDPEDRAAVLAAIANSRGVLAGFDAPLLNAIAASDSWCDRLLNTGTSPVVATDLALVSSLQTVGVHDDPAVPWSDYVTGSIAVQRIDASHEELMSQEALRRIGPFLAESLAVSEVDLATSEPTRRTPHSATALRAPSPRTERNT